jgi:hypothetical protein
VQDIHHLGVKSLNLTGVRRKNLAALPYHYANPVIGNMA